MSIDAIRGRGPVQPTNRGAARTGGQFAIPGSREPAGPDASSATSATGLVGDAMLALQESMADPVSDRAARRRGQDMLDELSALQRDLLGPDGPTPHNLTRLAALAAPTPMTSDPRLTDALEQIRLRATVELARYDSAT